MIMIGKNGMTYLDHFISIICIFNMSGDFIMLKIYDFKLNTLMFISKTV